MAIFPAENQNADWKTANQDLAAYAAAKDAHFNALRFGHPQLPRMALQLRAAL
jgi:hypothetical protein